MSRIGKYVDSKIRLVSGRNGDSLNMSMRALTVGMKMFHN